MSKNVNLRRLALLAVIVVAVGAFAAWRYAANRPDSADEAAVSKAEELNERYKAAGGSTQAQDAGAEDIKPIENKGPQPVDD